MAFIFLGLALVTTAISQFFLKLYHVKQNRLYILMAICLFSITPVFTFTALRELSLSTVYVSTAITQVMVLFLAKQFLNEKISTNQIKGVALILFGIVIFAI